MSNWLIRAIELAQVGRTAYQILLGNTYLTGYDPEGNPVPPDYSEARRWLEYAHSNGAATATYILGTMHENALGIPQNISRAVELYTTAASSGSFLACLNLARIYAHGKGIAISREAAASWYRKAMSFENEVDDASEIEEARSFLARNS